MTTNPTSHPGVSIAADATHCFNGIAHKAIKFTPVRGSALLSDGRELQKHPAPESVRLMFGAVGSVGAMGVGDLASVEPEVLGAAMADTQIELPY
jgi:hypothetical protein